MKHVYYSHSGTAMTVMLKKREFYCSQSSGLNHPMWFIFEIYCTFLKALLSLFDMYIL